MTVYHRNYLSPESQPWARDVEGRLNDLDRSSALFAQETNNTLLQLNSSVQLLSSQEAGLGQVNQDLFVTQAALSAVESTLDSTVADLAITQAEIDAVEADLAIVAAELDDTVDYLNSLQIVSATGSTSLTSVAVDTWSAGPSLTIATSTGNLKVTVSGLILANSGGFAVATFDIAGEVTRDAQITAFTSGTFDGVANALGSDGSLSGSFTQYVTGLPLGTSLTVQFQFRTVGGTGTAGYVNSKLIAEVVP